VRKGLKEKGDNHRDAFQLPVSNPVRF
jgi:hypothetical protein